MTISTPDIVRVIEARLTDCRCFGSPVDPKGFKPCGGCEHDKHCLDEIVRLRAERDEARREVLNALHEESDTMTEQDKIVVLQDNHRLRAENDTFRRERDEAIRERDEARREVCELQANEVNRLSSAVRLKNWICEQKTEGA